MYVTTPALRSALFGPVTDDDEEMGPLAETTVFAQWFHANFALHHARWRNGEVDIVHLDRRQRPSWCVEVKWADRHVQSANELKSLWAFTGWRPDVVPLVTTRTMMEGDVRWPGNARLDFVPTSLYYIVGHRAVSDPSEGVPWIVID